LFGVLCFLPSDLRAGGKAEPAEVQVDMGMWYRRDWDGCQDPTVMGYSEGVVRIESDHSHALFWQIPKSNGAQMPLDLEKHTWLDECKRPPRGFSKDVMKDGTDDLIDVSDFRYVSWRWKAVHSTIDTQEVEASGKLPGKYDDFPLKIGISILKKGSNKVREVAYVWSKALPEELMFKTETTIIPGIWKMTWRRFVVEAGTENMGTWVSEVRDLYADYKKGYPGEERGKIVRVYLMTDSDNTESRTAGEYADLVFHRNRPQ
jgi:hypothetical protein